MLQEIIAFGIVGVVAGIIGWKFYRSTLAAPLSNALLRRGHVKLAMVVRFGGTRGGPGAQAREKSSCCG